MTHSTPSASQPFRLFHIIGALLVLLLALLLPGCSAVKMGYNNAPELSYWWLDSYLDLDDPQSIRLRANLADLHAWHRASELPIYAGTLEKLQRMAPGNVTPAQVCDLSAELKTRFQAVLDQAAPAVATLAPTLKAAQLDHLARQFDKRNQKWRGEWLDGTPAERSARRVKQLTERAELLYGRLEEAQRAVLRGGMASSTFDASLTYREAVRRQQDSLQTLRQLQGGGLSDLRSTAELRALIGRSMNSPDATYRNYLERTSTEACQAFADLHNSATPGQRLRLMETLKDYESDARALSLSRR